MHTKDVMMFGQPATMACDGLCTKAWGIMSRPKERFSTDDDDTALLADGELGNAPADPGTYEGGHAKPDGPHQMNKWCARECERSVMVDQGTEIRLPDFTRRRYNKPWLHPDAQKESKTT
jgi:hypothetical protein